MSVFPPAKAFAAWNTSVVSAYLVRERKEKPVEHQTYGDSSEQNERGYNDIFGSKRTRSGFVPSTCIANQVVLGKHPVTAGLHAEAAVVDEKNEICPLPIPTFHFLERRLVRRRMVNIAVET